MIVMMSEIKKYREMSRRLAELAMTVTTNLNCSPMNSKAKKQASLSRGGKEIRMNKTNENVTTNGGFTQQLRNLPKSILDLPRF